MKPHELAFLFFIFLFCINAVRLFEYFMSDYCGNGKKGGKRG